MSVQEDFEKLGSLVTRVSVTVERKVSDGNYGSNGASLVLEANVAKGADLDAVCEALDAYGKAYCARSLGEAIKQVREQAMPEQAEPPASFPPPEAAPAEAPAPAKEGEEGHTRIARFVLTPKPRGLFLLELYPLLGTGEKKAKYPELKFTANRDAMWKLLGEEWKEGWQPPCDEEVDWLVDWRLGNEYVKTQGPHAGEKGRYRDVVAIHGA